MKIMTFTGWGQHPAALDGLADVMGADEIVHAAYQQQPDITKALAALKVKEVDVVIGWSLGGQVAMQALLEGKVVAKHLVLVSVPFQFTGGDGMPVEEYEAFCGHFEADAAKALKHLERVMLEGDEEELVLPEPAPTAHAGAWLRWLGEKKAWKPAPVKEVSIVQGREDRVVPSQQAGRWWMLMPKAEVHLIGGCGHVPQLHKSVLEALAE